MQLLIIYCVIFGTTFGSFLTAAVSRQITGGSILRPARSHCDQCSRQLAWFELIPIISFVVLRGRCRTCLYPIPYHVLLAEVFAGCLMLNFQPNFHHICFIVIGFLLLYLSLWDWQIQQVASRTLRLLGIVCCLTAISSSHQVSFWVFLIIWLANQFVTKQNRFIGLADIDVFCCLGMVLGLLNVTWVLLIASCLAIVVQLAMSRHQLAFLPFLSVGFLVVILTM